MQEDLERLGVRRHHDELRDAAVERFGGCERAEYAGVRPEARMEREQNLGACARWVPGAWQG